MNDCAATLFTKYYGPHTLSAVRPVEFPCDQRKVPTAIPEGVGSNSRSFRARYDGQLTVYSH